MQNNRAPVHEAFNQMQCECSDLGCSSQGLETAAGLGREKLDTPCTTKSRNVRIWSGTYLRLTYTTYNVTSPRVCSGSTGTKALLKTRSSNMMAGTAPMPRPAAIALATPPTER